MISPADFESLVEEALEKLPKKFADLLDNVVIVVEEEPSDDDLDLLDDEEDDEEDYDEDDDEDEEGEGDGDGDGDGDGGGDGGDGDGGHGHTDSDAHGHGHGDHGHELLGIYRGIALTHRTHDMLPALPDQIAIFRGPILRVARNRNDAVQQIRETVIHELGHYFGLSDAEMIY
jgi:predicted Zn-dependent protease with MMP-like domain